MTVSTDTDPGGRSAVALPRRPWFDDKIDRLLFLIFFLGGFVLIMFIKIAGRALLSPWDEPTEPRLLAAFVAAALLLLYAYVTSRMRAFRLHPERLGDNCYYLGLLYTLASLSAALIELERATPEARGALIESLLASFGIALSSTILGIALRAWFVQMRREIEDLEAEVHRDLTEAAQKLKDQLLFAVTELESFRLRTQQVLYERLMHSSDLFTATAERQARAIEELAERLSHALAASAEKLQHSIAAFCCATDDAVAAIGTFAGKIRAAEVPRDIVAGPARRLKDTVEGLAASVAKLEGASNRLTSVVEQGSADFRASLAEIFAALEQLVARLSSATEAASALDTLARESEPVRNRLAELSGTLAELLHAAREDAREIRSLRDQIRSDLTEYHRLQRELGHGLAEIAETIVKRLEA